MTDLTISNNSQNDLDTITLNLIETKACGACDWLHYLERVIYRAGLILARKESCFNANQTIILGNMAAITTETFLSINTDHKYSDYYYNDAKIGIVDEWLSAYLEAFKEFISYKDQNLMQYLLEQDDDGFGIDIPPRFIHKGDFIGENEKGGVDFRITGEYKDTGYRVTYTNILPVRTDI